MACIQFHTFRRTLQRSKCGTRGCRKYGTKKNGCKKNGIFEHLAYQAMSPWDDILCHGLSHIQCGTSCGKASYMLSCTLCDTPRGYI